jgi:hypothetical protein
MIAQPSSAWIRPFGSAIHSPLRSHRSTLRMLPPRPILPTRRSRNQNAGRKPSRMAPGGAAREPSEPERSADSRRPPEKQKKNRSPGRGRQKSQSVHQRRKPVHCLLRGVPNSLLSGVSAQSPPTPRSIHPIRENQAKSNLQILPLKLLGPPAREARPDAWLQASN